MYNVLFSVANNTNLKTPCNTSKLNTHLDWNGAGKKKYIF